MNPFTFGTSDNLVEDLHLIFRWRTEGLFAAFFDNED